MLSYRELGEDVEAFASRIAGEPGPIGIRCSGHYRQYVAYLAALNASCPVLLMGQDQDAETTGLSLAHLYSPATDELVRLGAAATDWHPDLAVLLSTSGSTGSAKWVRLSYRNLASNAASIAEYLALGPQDRAPMALPFQYSYGMSVVNSHLAVCAAIVLTEGSVVDAGFWEIFERCGCTSLAGVPHSFELMEKARIRTDHLGSLRYMTQAGGRLDAARVRQWAERGRAEGWDFFVMYGQTEAAPRISYLPPAMALDTPSAIGIAIPGGEMWVADEFGRPLADGMPGELCYRGPNTMMGYAQSDADLLEGQGSNLLKTGDIAQRLPNGLFEIVGRKSRFVKLFGLRIGLDEIDRHLQGLGLEAACVARGEGLFVMAVDGPAMPAEGLDHHLADWLGVPAGSFRIVQIQSLPRQPSGKVDLQALGAMLEDMPATDNAATRQDLARTGLRAFADRILFRRRRDVAGVFKAHFPRATVTSATSFEDLGGDSLSYVAVSLELESVLGRLPGNWPAMRVADLEAQAGKRGWTTPLDTPTLLRALAIMLVVAGHFEFLGYGGGGAQTLLVVAGMSFAAFTLPQVFQFASVAPIAVLAVRIALITFGFTLLNFVATGYGEWPAFLFIGNWISPKVEGSAWFIEVYLQLLCVLMLVLSISAARRTTERQTCRATACAAAALVAVAAVSDSMVDTHHLFRRLPHLMAWIFMIGVAAGVARSAIEKAVVTAILLVGAWQMNGYQSIGPAFFALAVLTLVWLPVIQLPRIFATGLRMVAGASLIIYLSHFQFAAIARPLLGDNPAVSWGLAIVGGVVVWRLYDPVDAWLSQKIRTLLFAWPGQKSIEARSGLD
ncbi:AMP-binding protein [Albidovulum sediminis]|uniref:AMP-binding protein n=1 Tax=Albidovulum sediminis TaxID=3066345 RepID=A0ABT2NJV3_9RHOB|nr:AMP-binding protein [Defluviimonas sediminis]MCT8329199.1 AMP-binding protein [Defluviimonas sediminis]